MSTKTHHRTSTHHRTPSRRATLIAAATALAGGLALAAPLAASAHVHADPSEIPAGGSGVVSFTIGHGCDGSPTTAVTFDVPDEVAAVKPQSKPGWAIDVDGNTVAFTADTPLPDSEFDTFQLQLTVDDGAPEGTSIPIPVLQQCEQGSYDWSEVAAEGEAEPESPAPVVTVGAASEQHGHAATEGEHTDGEHAEQPASGEAAAEHSESSDGVPIAIGIGIGGLVLGALGLVLGAIALTRSRRA